MFKKLVQFNVKIRVKRAMKMCETRTVGARNEDSGLKFVAATNENCVGLFRFI